MSCGRWAAILLIAGTLVAPLAAVAVWARNRVLDTDAYVRTVAPLAADAAIRDAVADRVMEKIAGGGRSRSSSGRRARSSTRCSPRRCSRRPGSRPTVSPTTRS